MKKKGTVIIVIIGLMVIIWGVIRFYRPPVKVKEGRIAPVFTLEDLTGREESLTDYRGKIVIVEFWATSCYACHMLFPHIQRIYDNYKDRGVIILTVTRERDVEKIKRFVNDGGYTFPVLIDKNSSVSYAYRIIGIPMLFVLDREGKIQYIFRGYSPEIETLLRNTIDELLAKG